MSNIAMKSLEKSGIFIAFFLYSRKVIVENDELDVEEKYGGI